MPGAGPGFPLSRAFAGMTVKYSIFRVSFRVRFSGLPHPLLQTAGEMFEAKGETRLVDHLPQHRFAPGGKAFLQPVTASHEIVNPHARAEGASDRQRMGDDPGALAPIGVGEPALIGIDMAVAAKIIEIADDPLA